jgi:hypothetical protein
MLHSYCAAQYTCNPGCEAIAAIALNTGTTVAFSNRLILQLLSYASRQESLCYVKKSLRGSAAAERTAATSDAPAWLRRKSRYWLYWR